MNLVVDYGNSAAKVGIFDQHHLVEKHTFLTQDTLRNFLSNLSADHCIVSSVNTDPGVVASWLIKNPTTFILNPSLPIPVTNLYSTPYTLGADRIAGVCGAVQLFPDENTLTIDTGSCITFDFADGLARYHGGSIGPGLRMRFQAVHTFTAKLPLVTATEKPALIGNSTESSIQSGVINGMVGEIEGMISQYQEKYSDLRVILCGGDAGFFENKLKAAIFAIPDLVLIGLNSILLYNVKHR